MSGFLLADKGCLKKFSFAVTSFYSLSGSSKISNCDRSNDCCVFFEVKLHNTLPLIYMSLNVIGRASIVSCLVLESLTTRVNEVDQSGRVFHSYSLFEAIIRTNVRGRLLSIHLV